MKTKKKRLKGIIEAVRGILEGEEYKKKLKKKKAIDAFVTRMERKRVELEAQLKKLLKDDKKNKKIKELRNNLEILDEQIANAKALLDK